MLEDSRTEVFLIQQQWVGVDHYSDSPQQISREAESHRTESGAKRDFANEYTCSFGGERCATREVALIDRIAANEANRKKEKSSN